MGKPVADVKGREPAAVTVECHRCGWVGGGGECRIVKTKRGDYIYCPKCGGPCAEKMEPPKPDAT